MYVAKRDISIYFRIIEMSNYLFSLGDAFYVEKMNFKALQRRGKATQTSQKTGKIKEKKRFGKSLAHKAPAKLLILLDNKLKHFGKELIKVNTKELKASQYNHLNKEYQKKKLSQRWNDIGGRKVQRDLYSAFLIQHVQDDLKTIEQKRCLRDFAEFMILHDQEIERLNGIELSPALKNVL